MASVDKVLLIGNLGADPALLQARRRYGLSEGTNLLQRALLVLVLAVLVPPLGIVAGAWTMLVSGGIGFAILLAGAWSIVRPHGRQIGRAHV